MHKNGVKERKRDKPRHVYGDNHLYIPDWHKEKRQRQFTGTEDSFFPSYIHG